MEKWLVLSNCQTFGLAHSLTLQYPEAAIDAVDIWAYKSNVQVHDAKLNEYHRIIVHPEFLDIPESALAGRHGLVIVPSVFFAAYHPDCCYAASSSGGINSPIGAYNSMICLAAYRKGLSLDQTLSMYNAKIYEVAGFFDVWQEDRTTILKKFTDYGLDLSSAFNTWGRYRPFMYSVNHPAIAVVFDIARQILKRMNIEPLDAGFYPHDNLANGPHFSVYPEIAEHCGVTGCGYFKKQGEYRLMSQEDFIRASYRGLAGHEPKSIVVDAMANERFQRLLGIMEA
ncbi:WcbI family polysaccharide biosynthesis putative acetyltransferase [Allorhizobium pseudoryzae]|uniref:WcbI family polysaccharide biosynthesis putative acetyltransferase n=1 Tax=Allorhizobium pseudoryzae TaxID=379684 RepID=UPI003CFD8C4A